MSFSVGCMHQNTGSIIYLISSLAKNDISKALYLLQINLFECAMYYLLEILYPLYLTRYVTSIFLNDLNVIWFIGQPVPL